MTTMKTAPANKKDFSHIDNLEELHEEMRIVKVRIKETEKELAERWKQLPTEVFKGAVSLLLPVYLSNKVAGKSWSLVNNISKVFSRHQKTEGLKTEIMGNVKKLGLFTALKAGFNLWKKRQ